MNQELEERLCSSFPLLYRGKDEPPTQNLMCFGFECGDGWFNLIYELSSKLENIIKNMDQTDEYLPRAVQVKQKYAGLRFYISGYTDEMESLIAEACRKSYTICEDCGEPGTEYQVHGWYTTLCKKCFLKLGRR